MANFPVGVVSNGFRVSQLFTCSDESARRSPLHAHVEIFEVLADDDKVDAVAGFLSGLQNPDRHRAGRTLAKVRLPQRK